MRHLRKIRVEGDTAYVPLPQGYEAVIDTADVDLVGQFNWFILARPHTVYAARNRSRSEGPRGLALMHRLILSPPKGMTVDHINRNGLDNRRSNLRLATQAQNNANTGLRRNNTSGAKGVDRQAHASRWRAQITVNGKAKFLGLFGTFDEASDAYAKAAAEHFGDFAFVPHPVPRG